MGNAPGQSFEKEKREKKEEQTLGMSSKFTAGSTAGAALMETEVQPKVCVDDPSYFVTP